MQMLLQSQSTAFRLTGLKRLLAEAVEELASVMVEDEVMPDDLLKKLKAISYSKEDDDEDLMPPLDYKGVTIETELDDEMAAELNISDEDFADYKENTSKGIFSTTTNIINGLETTNIIDTEPEADLWGEGADAFQ